MPSPLKRRYHLMAGLPRSGSTLLLNVLAQNPNFNVTATSGLLAVLAQVRNTWDGIMEHRVADHVKLEETKRRVLRSMVDAYFDDTDKPVCFDKSRGWLAHLELGEAIMDRKPRVLVPVRDLRDVYASFEKLYRQRAATGMTTQEIQTLNSQNPTAFQTVEGRMRFLDQSNQVVGSAIMGIKEACYRGWRQSMHFIEYDRFVRDPKEGIREIYDFLGEERFDGHQYDNVEQVTYEDDFLWGWTLELHKIKPKIEKQGTRRNDVLPARIANVIPDEQANFWRQFDGKEGA